MCEFEDANSQEFSKTTTHPVVISMPEHDVEQKGGTMRLGERVSVFKDSATNSILFRLYGRKKRGVWLDGMSGRDRGAPSPSL